MWDRSVKFSPDLDDLASVLTFIPCFVVKVEGDPLEQNRYRLCVPTLFGYGEKNWTNWVHKAGFSNSSASYNGDVGMHWPSTPGEMGFYAVSQADYLNGFYMPCGVVSEEPDKSKTTIIKEAKNANKKNEGHMHYYMKTPSGHTLAFTDKNGDEGVALIHASGQGLFISGAFKGNNPNQNAKQETKVRTADVRGDKSVATQTADSPSKVFRDGQGVVSLLGQNGSGLSVLDTGKGGTVLLTSQESNSGTTGPSIYMTSEGGGLILLTAGNVQLQMRGALGDIKVTKQVIQEAIREDVETKVIKVFKNYLKFFWKRAFNIADSSSGDSNNPSNSNPSSNNTVSNTNTGNITSSPVTTTNSDGTQNISGI